ncbi:MAG: AraC family transcriptional regulator [Oscillospiraceae bacterium]|jgi:AraC family transcriptional regulator|nr:AraC family transcriptional regulator [Oscillospiraceae bacterium]
MLLSGCAGQAVGYILEHIRENPTVDQVADYCHFSKFYFSRRFKAETGESPYTFIRRARLEESAFRLKTEPERTITDIGWDCGYSSCNYSTVFRQRFGMGPMDFRRSIRQASFQHPFCHRWENGLSALEEMCGAVEYRNLPPLTVVYERHIGDYHDLGRQWSDFMAARRSLRTNRSQFLARSFHDPAITGSRRCVYDLCMTVDPDCRGEGVSVVPGGPHIVYPFRGPVWYIYTAYQVIFNLWLPQTGRRLSEASSYDLYHCMAGPEYVEMDICLPLHC